MFWYLKIIQQPKPKESDWNNSFQDLLSTARVFLENVPSVGIESQISLVELIVSGA